jgi:nucleoside-diphosphate-sugar epimerase
MTRIFLTGGTGHVGNIIGGLLENHYEIIHISFRKNKNIPHHSLFNLDDLLINETINPDDFLIHCASEIDYDNSNEEISRVNCMYTHSLLSKFKKSGLKNCILISSAPVGGVKDTIITENDCVSPQSLYHLSKYYQEKTIELLAFETYYNLRISSPISPFLRKENIFKIFMDNAILNNEIQIKGNGTRSQNYIDVRDVALIISKITANRYKSGTYNICAPSSISNFKLAQKIVSTINSKSKLTFMGQDDLDGHCWNFSIEKARKELEFNPIFTLEKTISDYYRFNK